MLYNIQWLNIDSANVSMQLLQIDKILNAVVEFISI